MQRKLYIILSLVMPAFLFSACDKMDLSSRQAETFIRYYGVGLEDLGTKVINTGDGYLIMANVRNPANRGRDICIINTDDYGNTLDPVLIIGGPYDDIGYAIKKYGEGYIISGSTQETADADKDIYIIQLGRDGSLLKNPKPIPIPYNNEAFDFVVENDGTLIITGYTETDDVTRGKQVLFLKYNPEMDTTLEFKSIGNKPDEVANAIALWKDDTYIFAGYKEDETRDIFLLRWDGSPNQLNLTIPTERNSEAVGILNTSLEWKYLVACNNEKPAGQSEILLLEVNTNMNIADVVSRPYGERDLNSVQSMAIHGNSVHLCGTSTFNESAIGDILLMIVPLEGNTPRYFYIGDGVSYAGYGFDVTDDNGFILTGAGFLNEKSSITLFKVDSEGNF